MTVLIIYCALTFALFAGDICLESKRKLTYNVDFMDKKHTDAIKGTAILCVVLSHIGNANETRLLAPGGGIGVALFLICSGYGLSESARKHFELGDFWKKRVTTVFIPYALTRVVMLGINPGETITEFLLDITCISPQYVLGWYLNYLLLCYVAFSVYWLMKQKFGNKALIFLFCIAAISFWITPVELQAEQSASFLTGILLSEYKKSAVLEKVKSYSKIIAGVSFCVGAVAFGFKQVGLFHFSYGINFLQMIYKFAWAIMLLVAVWMLMQRFTLKPVALLGKYSYEIYLTHGYMFSLMRSVIMIPLFILCVVSASMVLHCGIYLIRNKLYK